MWWKEEGHYVFVMMLDRRKSIGRENFHHLWKNHYHRIHFELFSIWMNFIGGNNKTREEKKHTCVVWVKLNVFSNYLTWQVLLNYVREQAEKKKFVEMNVLLLFFHRLLPCFSWIVRYAIQVVPLSSTRSPSFFSLFVREREKERTTRTDYFIRPFSYDRERERRTTM